MLASGIFPFKNVKGEFVSGSELRVSIHIHKAVKPFSDKCFVDTWTGDKYHNALIIYPITKQCTGGKYLFSYSMTPSSEVTSPNKVLFGTVDTDVADLSANFNIRLEPYVLI